MPQIDKHISSCDAIRKDLLTGQVKEHKVPENKSTPELIEKFCIQKFPLLESKENEDASPEEIRSKLRWPLEVQALESMPRLLHHNSYSCSYGRNNIMIISYTKTALDKSNFYLDETFLKATSRHSKFDYRIDMMTSKNTFGTNRSPCGTLSPLKADLCSQLIRSDIFVLNCPRYLEKEL
ncbi:hypothetical protein CEXT_365801 [Caerostris extrusa]|uniref:Uncharacterized protein n=1 Tax=Caerostris extrusa TaxID=172846 RepID=A0AAV4VDL8_CAEEX|nr:hypothetical protein CEXT_365801 [Caerostris extrusa]